MLLIIHNRKRDSRALSDLLYHMGVISIAATPEDALDEASDGFRGIVIMDPETIPDVEDLVKRLRLYGSRVPIFILQSPDRATRYDAICDHTISSDTSSISILEQIIEYQRKRDLPLTARYQAAGIDASCNLRVVRFFERSIRLTKTETMILRCLIASYPTPRDTEDILRYAFSPTRRPEPNVIRTHVSVINKKFKSLTGSQIIQSFPGQGYVVCTPELRESLKAVEAAVT